MNIYRPIQHILCRAVIFLFYAVNNFISNLVWGAPMLAVFTGTGLFLSARTGFFQITGLRRWVGGTVGTAFKGKKVQKNGDGGSISQGQALCAALAACLGTGNIVGVATAITSGGAGAVFWMLVSAILGTMTCCTENMLGIMYRRRDSDGNWSGGPIMYIEQGLGMKKLAKIYAFFLVGATLGMGCMVQANSIASALQSAVGVKPAVTGIILSVLTLVIISGGIKRIAAFSTRLIPILSAVFTAASLAVIAVNYKNILPCVRQIFSGAKSMKAARFGIARGVFSNEAGLGTSALIHSSADCESPAQQGFWGILEVTLDTVIMCTVTAFAILTSGADTKLPGARLSSAAFACVFGKAGEFLICVSVCLFAFATLTAWAHYGQLGAVYLFGEKSKKAFLIIYAACIFLGSVTKLDAVWSISDTLNGLMAIPNLFAVLALSGQAVNQLGGNRLRLRIGHNFKNRNRKA